jgi:hypothetical protein
MQFKIVNAIKAQAAAATQIVEALPFHLTKIWFLQHPTAIFRLRLSPSSSPTLAWRESPNYWMSAVPGSSSDNSTCVINCDPNRFFSPRKSKNRFSLSSAMV